MKIFNKENGIEKVYVQYDDLMMLYNSDIVIPASIFDKVYTDGFHVDERNRFDFVEFTDKEEVNFFRYIDWILDYKKLNKMSPFELNRAYINSIININDFIIKYGRDFTSDDLVSEYDILTHKSNSIKNFYMAKFDGLNMNFPQVPNYEKLIIDDSKNTGQIVSKGIDPNTIVVYKASHEPFRGDDTVYTQLINKAIGIVSAKDNDDIRAFFNYHSTYDLSDNNMFFIIKYRDGKNNSIGTDDDFLFKKRKYKINKFFNKVLKKRNDNF